MKLTRSGFLKSLAGLTFASLPWSKTGLLLSAQAAAGQPARTMQIEDVEIYPFNVPYREPFRIALAWIIHEVSSQKSKDALKGMMNTGFARPAFPFGASIA
jgi:hypothetical protein